MCTIVTTPAKQRTCSPRYPGWSVIASPKIVVEFEAVREWKTNTRFRHDRNRQMDIQCCSINASKLGAEGLNANRIMLTKSKRSQGKQRQPKESNCFHRSILSSHRVCLSKGFRGNA